MALSITLRNRAARWFLFMASTARSKSAGRSPPDASAPSGERTGCAIPRALLRPAPVLQQNSRRRAQPFSECARICARRELLTAYGANRRACEGRLPVLTDPPHGRAFGVQTAGKPPSPTDLRLFNDHRALDLGIAVVKRPDGFPPVLGVRGDTRETPTVYFPRLGGRSSF